MRPPTTGSEQRGAMSKITPRTFKGTRDFLSAEMIRREELFEYLRSVYRRYGFAPLETPAMEFLEILLGKYGIEGEKLLYRLAYRDGNTLALRYDLTVPLARVAAQYRDIPKPYKRYQMQPVWRADRPQLVQGRFREFYQCDADIVGESSRVADAEILCLCSELLEGLGVGACKIRINHRKILEAVVAAAGLPDSAGPAVLRAVDKVDKVGEAGIEAELDAEGIPAEARSVILDLLAHPKGGVKEVRALSERLSSVPSAVEGCGDLEEVFAAFGAMGGNLEHLEFRLTLARGLDYYTGVVFEAYLEALPHIGSLSGGGRYDDLVSLFSKEAMPAVGATIGFDRILTALDQLGKSGTKSTRTAVLVLQFDESSQGAALRVLGGLRRAGLAAEVWYHPEKLGKQVGQADKRGIPMVTFQGPDERARGTWQVKHLPSSSQREVTEEELATAVAEMLGQGPN